ncbi:MAG: hypothetical protein ACM3P0_08955 [Acidobacteriota bacterium]
MITAFIFFVHLVFVTVIFTKKWQDEGLSTALSNVALIVILFSVGWAVTGMIARALMEPKGFGLYFDRDTFSLFLLSIAEFFFYKLYYGENKEKEVTEDDTEKQ